MNSKMPKIKKRFYRWIAIALTLVLLIGQGNISVLAEENLSVTAGISNDGKKDTTQTGTSNAGGIDDADDTETLDQNEGNEDDNLNTGDNDNSSQNNGDNDNNNQNNGDNDNDNQNTGDSDNDNQNTGDSDNNDQNTGNNDNDDQNTGDNDNDDQNNIGDNDNDNQNTDNSNPDIEDDENTGNENIDGQELCICDTKCTADTVNMECPICSIDYISCLQETISEQPAILSIAETALLNDEEASEEEMLVPAADEGVEEWEQYDFEYDGIHYRFLKDGQVEVGGQCKKASGNVVIPETVLYDGATYQVTAVGAYAFYLCTGLNSIEIPNSVTSIGARAFELCSNLDSIKIPDSVTSIGYETFLACGIKSIELPDSITTIEEGLFVECVNLTHVKIPDSVTKIDACAFMKCSRLNSIEIPNSVTYIGEYAFQYCFMLSNVKIRDNITVIELLAFANCPFLNTLQIMISSDKTVTPPQVNRYAFDEIPSDRSIVFLAEDGTRLTGDAFEAAKTAYLTQKDPADASGADLWWGWKIEEPPAVVPAYKVTINVNKNGNPWPDHGRTFALLADNGASFITDLTQVPSGTYDIYDITGINPDSYWSKAVDTGKDVRVSGTDTDVDITVPDETEATIHYFTVTFYDGDTAYEADTPQRPQIVLSNQSAIEPTHPVKTGQRFTGWKTQKEGGTAFDFSAPVKDTTPVFASWASAPVSGPYYITATAQAGGTISPAGVVGANKGDSQSFTIAADTGFHIKSVMVDGIDVTTSVLGNNGIYTFTDIDADHTITAVFEADTQQPGDGNTPDGNTPGGNDIPDGGTNAGGNNTAQGGGNQGTNAANNTTESTDNRFQGSDTILVSENNNPGGEYTPANQNTPNSVSPPPGENSAPNVTPTVNSKTAEPGEPKTGDVSPVEIYATIAMVSGLTYLLLYFMDEERGMTEREKDVFVAAFIRWAKKGGKFRKCCALAAIFCLLVYYHSIGKRSCKGKYNENRLKQAFY